MSLTETMSPGLALGIHQAMVRIRLFESRVEELFKAGELPGFVHTYIGQEAIAAGVCAALNRDDYITSTHRGHGHAIAKAWNSVRSWRSCTARRPGPAGAGAVRCTWPTSRSGC